MLFELDDQKNQTNIAKHGISFKMAKRIFDGQVLSAIDGRFDYGEERKISIGSIDDILILLVIHTSRKNNTTRIISARKANKAERVRYEQTLR